MITVALAKGRLAEVTVNLMTRCGVDCSILEDQGRKLVFENGQGFRFIMVKPSDVPTYVHHGVADIGVAGKDTILESGLPLYEMLDLGVGKCKLSVCGFEQTQDIMTVSNKRVATKYPNIAKRYYQAKGESVEVIKLNGSIEIAPILGLSDVILDIVESGKTLKENGLSVLEDVCEVSARVIVNRISLKTKGADIKKLIEGIRENL